MQSVLVLPLVVPPQVEAAADLVAPSDGAFQLSFAADAVEAEKLSAPREGGDPTPLALMPGLPFPLVLTLPTVPDATEGGLTVAVAPDQTVKSFPETIGIAPERLADAGGVAATALASPDVALPVDAAPVETPVGMQRGDGSSADLPQADAKRMPDVSSALEVQPPAYGQTGTRSAFSVPEPTVPAAQRVPVRHGPEAQAVSADVRTSPFNSAPQPPLTVPVPDPAQRPDSAGQPQEAITVDMAVVSVPVLPPAPAKPQTKVSAALVLPGIADRPDSPLPLQPAIGSAEPIPMSGPVASPVQDAPAPNTAARASGPAVPATTEPLVAPTADEPAPPPDPPISVALPESVHPGADNRVIAPLAPAISLPNPTPGFWERLFTGLVAVPSDREDGDPVPEDPAPPTATAVPRDAKLLPPTVSAPSEPAAVALFARDQSQAQGQGADDVPDAGTATSLIFASAPGPMAAAPATPFAPQAGPTHLPVPQVAGQIAAALSKTSDGATELALSPEELGHVRLKLERDAKHPERMIVHITFERPETLDLFRRHAGELAEALRDAGFAGADIGFGQQGGGSNEFNRGEDSRAFAGAAVGGPGEPLRPEPSSPRLMAGASLDLRV